MSPMFRAMTLDDSPTRLEQSYRLRYQVYCLERHFLPAENYPTHLEIDAFDRDSVHVGVVDPDDALAGTARIVRAGRLGLPLFRHCTLFPHVTTFSEPGHTVVEVSRVSISRHYARRRDDPPFNPGVGSVADEPAAVARARHRRQHRAQPFITLVRAIMTGVKEMGATHLIGATDAAFHRWLVHYGLPYHVAGPEVEYYGRVAPYIMSMAELDQVIVGGQFAVLDDFPVGMDPARWSTPNEHGESLADRPTEAAMAH